MSGHEQKKAAAPIHEVCLVIPTIREEQYKQFAKSWSDIGLLDHVDLLVVEDNPEKTFDIVELPGGLITHIAWGDIDGGSEKPGIVSPSWIIPRRSDTVRSAGYYEAWKRGYRYVMTLDDDCRPPSMALDGFEYKRGAGSFVAQHVDALTKKTRWFSTLNDVKPRGVPYFNLGKNDRVVLNHGLWTNVLDYDAPTQLVNPGKERFSFDNRIVPARMYFPFCGMNAMWERNATVLMYHLLMGSMFEPRNFDYARVPENLTKLPFDRFGDIWCGIFAKKILDVAGLQASTGTPYIRHDRASNPFTNLKKEANGLEVNEKLWEHVDRADLQPGPLWKMYEQLGAHIETYRDFPEYRAYFSELGEAMQTWARLFDEGNDQEMS